MDDNGGFLATSSKQKSEDEQREARMRIPHTEEDEEPEDKGQRERTGRDAPRHLPACAQVSLLGPFSHLYTAQLPWAPFPPLLWVINGELRYLRLNNARLRHSSEFSTNLFKRQFPHP